MKAKSIHLKTKYDRITTISAVLSKCCIYLWDPHWIQNYSVL